MTTMANTSVATASTLSKEATLMLLSASPAPLCGLVDSSICQQSTGHKTLNNSERLWFAGHIVSAT